MSQRRAESDGFCVPKQGFDVDGRFPPPEHTSTKAETAVDLFVTRFAFVIVILYFPGRREMHSYLPG